MENTQTENDDNFFEWKNKGDDAGIDKHFGGVSESSW
jgi:hypothetical protein